MTVTDEKPYRRLSLATEADLRTGRSRLPPQVLADLVHHSPKEHAGPQFPSDRLSAKLCRRFPSPHWFFCPWRSPYPRFHQLYNSAALRGCSLLRFRLGAKRSIFSFAEPDAGFIATTTGFPSIKAPILPKITASTFSNARAPGLTPTMIGKGVARPSGQG